MDCCICGKEIRDGDAIAGIAAGKVAHVRCVDEKKERPMDDDGNAMHGSTGDGKIVRLRNITTLDIEPDLVLDGAKKRDLEKVFVIGEKDGELYAAASTSAIGDVMVLFERFKRQVI